MKDFEGGCCGHPPSCKKSGRCRAYEDFTKADLPLHPPAEPQLTLAMQAHLEEARRSQ